MFSRGWALDDEELAPGVRSVAAPVGDGRTAGDVSAAWALWRSRPHVESGQWNETSA
jgi:IclR family pca regulon transcriptional regulator